MVYNLKLTNYWLTYQAMEILDMAKIFLLLHLEEAHLVMGI